MSVDTKKLMKVPLIIAAALVVLRVLFEQAGAPGAVNNIFGVVWLYFTIPFYFAFQIAASGEPRPFKALFKNLLIFTFWTRVMVLPTYWLAYALQWSAPRFNRGQADVVVGEGVSPLTGYLLVPVRNLAVWVILSTLVGMILGGITLFVRRSATPSDSAT